MFAGLTALARQKGGFLNICPLNCQLGDEIKDRGYEKRFTHQKDIAISVAWEFHQNPSTQLQERL
jgi:hypothetical protein